MHKSNRHEAMITFDIGEARKFTKMLAPMADFDGVYTFYYDETNNIRKFYVRETDFNSAITDNFVLGGLVHEGSPPDVQPLIDSLKLQKTANEVKLKHIAKGDFIECLSSQKLNLFLKYIVSSNLYIHYSTLNILYWSIVDIVDSAISHSDVNQRLGLEFANKLKDDLYKLAKIEIDSVVLLFRKYEYPNIKHNNILPFIEELSDLFSDYLDNIEFNFGLESLRQILKEARKAGSLPFVMDEKNFVLIDDFTQFYLRPVYLFKNSKHIFDNEDSIVELLANYKIMDGQQEINNFSFLDSKSSVLTQLSDVFVGLIGKLGSYMNKSTREKIYSDFCALNQVQSENIDLLLKLIDRSHNKNIGFLHATDSYEEISKIEIVRACREKSPA
ncbi:MAG: DUF3800 domain-containing protein [Desulfobulbus sp.]|nr:DUF3800 domain-containing protein [Desulfobulbus sp.]